MRSPYILLKNVPPPLFNLNSAGTIEKDGLKLVFNKFLTGRSREISRERFFQCKNKTQRKHELF